MRNQRKPAKPDTNHLQREYDRLASQYALHLYNELDGKPQDRELLDVFAAQVRDTGVVCDVGCGPGHVAAYLWERGVTDLCGLDLAPAMVQTAHSLNPHIPFYEGNLLALDVADGAWAGVTAFYAFVNFPASGLPAIFAELRRVLARGGWLLCAFHAGQEVKHVQEMWGVPVTLDFYFFETRALLPLLRKAGFAIERVVERAPYPEVEYPSRRAYILARAE